MNREIRRIIRRAKTWITFVKEGYPNFYWPTEYHVVTQAFGVNYDYYKQFGLPGHEGIDLRAPNGTDIYAVWNGQVVMVKDSHPDLHAYGYHCRIDHYIIRKFGTKRARIHYQSIYAHLIKPPLVKVGDIIKKGQLIGLADNTGNSIGAHLHFGLKQFNFPEYVPDTKMQNNAKAKWAKQNFIDPTLFFRELRDGYE
jgi:murein DD-endopeptidase MepM/ murein hydrolase activator NlpD